MTLRRHLRRIAALMAMAAALLGWLAASTEIFVTDGLRYIAQAQRFERGELAGGLKAVDHPAYPLAVAAAHRFVGGDGPGAWQVSAQVASVLAGVLLVIPLYLVGVELLDERRAWLPVLLVYLAPQTGRVLADVLCEGTFLVFWGFGLWAALRFLREGTFLWLPPMIAFGGLAYLTRPEGLLLPAAMVATLAAVPLLRSTRLLWPRWWAAVGFLVLGPALVVAPYVAAKGTFGTKPAVARLLGQMPEAPADAVERAEPLAPGQSTARTYRKAATAVAKATRDLVSPPLLVLAAIGLAASWPPGERSRAWLLLSIILGASALALVRLHATGGYCSPRHTFIPSLILIMAAAQGLGWVLDSATIPARWLGQEEGRLAAGPAVWAAVLLAFAAWSMPRALRPVGDGYGGYLAAARYLETVAGPGERVADVTGYAQYFSGHEGYDFGDLILAPGDPGVRWVVARGQHLVGPWWYCRKLDELVGGRAPVAVFPEHPAKGDSRIYVFDRALPPAQARAPGVPRR